MAKRSFLIPLAAAIAALTPSAQSATKAIPTQPVTDIHHTLAAPAAAAATLPSAGEEKQVLVPVGDNLFSFVIERAQDGTLLSYHQSHYSHRSHSSHSSHESHSSHYSSRY